MLKHIMIAGSLGGLTGVAYVFLLDRSGLIYTGWGAWLGYAALVIMPLATFLALHSLRNRVYGGRLPLKQALICGMMISLIAALIFCIYNYIMIHLPGNAYVGKIISLTETEMKSNGSTPEQVKAATTRIQEHYSSHRPYTNTLKWYLGLGFLYTMGSYLIIKLIKPKRP